MSWVCPNCGTNNDDANVKCSVCDYELPPVADVVDKPYIFVSYAHSDADKVYPIIDALQKQFYVWFDTALEYGTVWEDNIFSKIKNSTIFLFIVTKASLEDGCFCRNEIDFARRKFKGNHHKRFINLIIDDSFEFPDWFDGGYMLYQACYLSKFKTIQEAIEDLSRNCPSIEMTLRLGKALPSKVAKSVEKIPPIDEKLVVAKTKEIKVEPIKATFDVNVSAEVLKADGVDKQKPTTQSSQNKRTDKLTKAIAKTLPLDKNGTLVIPDGYETIDLFAFTHRDDIINVVIPSSVRTINEGAFSSCDNIVSVAIADGLQSINKKAFSYCAKLREIRIPNTVVNIGNEAFEGCNNLLYNEYENAYYLGNETNSYLVLVKAKNVYVTSCVINKNCKIVIGDAFSHCPDLQRIEIPNSVKSLWEGMFKNCRFLNGIIFNGTKEEWNSINILEDKEAKTGKLGNFVITCNDGSISRIGERDLEYCTSSTSKAKTTTKKVSHSTNANPVAPTGEMSASKSVSIKIRNDGTLVVPYGYTSIGRMAFMGRSTMIKLSIPSSVEKISKSAFANCNNLESVISLGKVTVIEDGAFMGCTKLSSIIIPNSVVQIGAYSFKNCVSLKSIVFEGTKAQWKKIDKVEEKSVSDVDFKTLAWNYNTGKYVVHCTDGDIPKRRS